MILPNPCKRNYSAAQHHSELGLLRRGDGDQRLLPLPLQQPHRRRDGKLGAARRRRHPLSPRRKLS